MKSERMGGARLGITLGLLLWATACAQSTTTDKSNGQTHWLLSCDTNADCGELSCLCGVCVERCGLNDECTKIEGTVCTAAETLATQQLCGVNAPPLCLASCLAHVDCPEGQACESSVCIPEARMSAVPNDGGVLASEAALQARRLNTICESTPTNLASGEIVFLWDTFTDEHGSPWAMRYAPVNHPGSPWTGFQLALDCAPDEASRYTVGDADAGDQVDPTAQLASAGILLMESGFVSQRLSITDAHTHARGQVPGVYLFWTATDLSSTAGLRGAHVTGPLTAGYHLFRHTSNGFQELPLDSVLTMGTELGLPDF